MGVAGQQDHVVAEGQDAVVQGGVQGAAHGAGALGVSLLEVGPGDPVGEQRVAAEQRAVGDQQAGHVGGVAGQRQRADGDIADADRLAVVQRGDRVGDAAFERRDRKAQRRAGLRGQRACAGEVVGVQVGVDDVGDHGAELGRERDVERRRRAPGRRRAPERRRRSRRTGTRDPGAGPGAPRGRRPEVDRS